MFVRLDGELKYGVSRQLVLDVFERMGIIEDQKKKLDFLNESGYEQMRQKMLKSMSLKHFLTTIERYAVKDGVEDTEFTTKFLEIIEQEKLLVSFNQSNFKVFRQSVSIFREPRT